MTPCEIHATRSYLQAGPTRLSYLEWDGAGTPVVLLHGITSSAATLWRVAPALAALGHHVFALDMPGHGESDMSTAHDMDSIADLAGALIIARELRGVTLIGHSWGGATALALASGDHPARAAIARVALVDPALSINPEDGREAMPNYLEGVGESAAFNETRLRTNNPTWAECDIFWKIAALEQCRAEQVEGFFTGGGNWSLEDRLGEVSAPLLLLVADLEYTVIPPDRLGEVKAKLRPGLGAMQIIPGTTHNMLRGPGYVPTMEALTGWLKRAR
ncbi:alpha/beta hydrolase [Chloroflexales bacterium ZM16-3]|nr:alpha/beta hydrolase [Chloroflexales bacterium ZM16-3]